MQEKIEWTYEDDNVITPHHFTRLTNGEMYVYLSVSLYKERWHYYASMSADSQTASWLHDPNDGWATVEEAKQAALDLAHKALDPEHITWYECDNWGVLYWEAWYKPLDASLSVFQRLDEESEPIDEYWHWQFYMPPDYIVVSADKDPEEHTAIETAKAAVTKYANLLKEVIEKENAIRKEKERIQHLALKNRKEANVDVKYVEGKPTLFD